MLQKGSPPADALNPVRVTDYSAIISEVLIGIGYSIYATAIWGSIPYTVPEKVLGSAFGMTTAIQNSGLVVAPLIVSYLIGKDKQQPTSEYPEG